MIEDILGMGEGEPKLVLCSLSGLLDLTDGNGKTGKCLVKGHVSSSFHTCFIW